VEKALDSGNVTTESKLVRESYSNVQKDNPRKKKQKDEDYSEYTPVDDEMEPEEDADDWSMYIRSRFTLEKSPNEGFRAWSSKLDFRDISDIWKRYPRGEWSHENKPDEKIVTVKKREEKIPLAVERRIPYENFVYKRLPYEVKVPVSHFYMEQRTENRVPVKIYLSMPEVYQIERQVPYEMKIDNPASYRVEVSQPYAVEKKAPVALKVADRSMEVKAPVEEPYAIENNVPIALKVADPSMKVKMPMEKPYAAERLIPVAVKVLDSLSQAMEKPVESVEVKPYSVPVRVDKSHEVREEKSVPYMSIFANLDGKDRDNASKDKEATTESESAEDMVNAMMG